MVRGDRSDGKRGLRETVRLPAVQGPGLHARDRAAVPPGRETSQPAAAPGGRHAEAVRLRRLQEPAGRPAERVVRVFPAVPGARAVVRRPPRAGRRLQGLHDRRLLHRGGRVERRMRVRRIDDGCAGVPGHRSDRPASAGRPRTAEAAGDHARRRRAADRRRATTGSGVQADGAAGVRPRVFRRAPAPGRPAGRRTPTTTAIRRRRRRGAAAIVGRRRRSADEGSQRSGILPAPASGRAKTRRRRRRRQETSGSKPRLRPSVRPSTPFLIGFAQCRTTVLFTRGQ